MIISELKMFNFGPYKGFQSLRFSKQDRSSHRNITLIGGLNGSGKTSILEAVLLALYGNKSPAFRAKQMSYSDYLCGLINRTATENQARVEVLLDLPLNGRLFYLHLKREWQAGTRINDRVTVCVNGNEDKLLASNWSSYVEELLPSSMAPLFFFDGETISGLAIDEGDNGINEAIKTMIGINIIDRLILDLRRIIEKQRGEIGDASGLQEQINKHKEEARATAKDLAVVQQEIAGLNVKIERLKVKLSEAEDKYTKSGGVIQEKRAEMLGRKKALEEQLLSVRHEIVSLASGSLPLILVSHRLQRMEEAVRDADAVLTARRILSALNEIRTRLEHNLREANVESETLETILSVVDKEVASTETAASREAEFTVSDITQKQLQGLLAGGLKTSVERAADLVKKYEELELSIEQVERHLITRVDPGLADEALNDYKELLSRLKSLELEKEKKNQELQELTRCLHNIEVKIRSLTESLIRTKSQSEDARRIIKYALKSQDILLSFRHQLLINKANTLARNLTECFKFLTHKRDLVAEIRVDPHTLRVILLNEESQEIPKDKLSAGERQMLAVSLLWAITKTSKRPVPIIIDTPMGRLDNSHRESFVKSYLPNASHQVIILSTDSEIIGDYYALLKDFIGHEYYLSYEGSGYTTITNGYFGGRVG